MRPVSAKRRKRDNVYAAARRAVWDRSEGICEARTDVCTGRCEQVHHRAGRTGPEPHALTNLLGCCRECHSRIHARPAESYAAGWMVRRNVGDAA